MGQRDVERFERTILPHLDDAYTLARYLLRDEHDAQDVVQDAVLRALRYFEGYRDGDARAWLLTIERRCCYAWADREGRQAPAMDPDLIEELPGDTDDPETEAVRGELRQKLASAVDALPLPFREVIVLREIQELSYQEIATVTGVPVGTVMSRLARARRRLQRALEAQGMER